MENKEIKKKSKVKEIREKKKVDKMSKKDNKLQEENALLQDKILRVSAEMQNMRRRYDEEIAKICKYEGEELIIKLLPIVDNFERAIKLDDNDLTDELSKFLSGFKMIYTNLVSLLNAMEVKEIDCLNKEFDPKVMQAILTDKDSLYPSNTVLEVLQKGYIYKDKLLRPAMVKVNE